MSGCIVRRLSVKVLQLSEECHSRKYLEDRKSIRMQNAAPVFPVESCTGEQWPTTTSMTGLPDVVARRIEQKKGDGGCSQVDAGATFIKNLRNFHGLAAGSLS